MKIAIDFDDTIVDTKKTANKLREKLNYPAFNNEKDFEKFYLNYFLLITEKLELKQNVFDILSILSKEHEIYIVTARNNKYFSNLETATTNLIKNLKLPVKGIYFDCYKEGKANKCIELGIDLFIDDSIENCLCVKNKGIETILFEKEHDGLKTCYNWNDLFNYIKEVKHGRKTYFK